MAACPAQADQYPGKGNTGFGGAIGNGTLTLSDDGTNILGTVTFGGSMDDVMVLYIQSGPGGFTNTSGFNDQGDSCRRAISGVSALGRSLLAFASGFQPNYAIALAPAAAGAGGLWQLANGGNNTLIYVTNVSLAPLDNSGPTSAEVAWPVWSSTLRLCQTTNLAAGQWTTVTNPVAQVGSENHVTVSPLSDSRFFRAEYP